MTQTLVADQLGVLVSRPRLEARLDRLVAPGPGPSMMLISAPPAFGKSTLVHAWAAGRAPEPPVAIADLREAVSGPRALWQVLLAALVGAVEAGLAGELRRLAVPDRLGHEDFIVELLDTLADRPLVLVMEDVQTVQNPAVLAELDRLLASVPPSLAVVLVSRTRPPLACLHDLRLRGRLDHLRAPELAFTPAEAAACCPGLTEEQQQRIWERTEGWPAMVRLMGLAVGDGLPDLSFWHEDDELAEHLFSELLGRRDPTAQQVLLAGAVADPTPLDLLVRLSGRGDAGIVLTDAAHRSGLVSAVSRADGTPSYHLHPMLRAYLHGEHLRRDAPGEQDAQTQAAVFFRERGEVVAAVRHALGAGDPGLLESTMELVGLRAVHEGLSEPLLEVLGSRVTRGSIGPWTAVVAAAAMLDAGRDVGAGAVLDNLDPGGSGDPALGVAHAAVASQLRRHRGRPTRSGPEVRDELTLAVPADVELAFALQRGTELLRVGVLGAAEDLLRRAVQLAEGHERGAALTDALIALAAVASARGDMRLLAERVEQAHAAAERTGWLGSARTAYLHLLAGWAAHQQLDDPEARRQAVHAGDLVDPQDDPTVVVAVRSLLAGCGEDAQRADTAWLHEAWQDSADRRLSPDLVAYTAVADARVSLVAGRVDRLRVIVEGLSDRLGACAERSLAEAGLRRARGQGVQALAALLPALRGEVDPVLPLSMVDVHCFASRLELEAGNRYRAVEEVRRALEVAERLACPRALLTGDPPVLDLLAEGRGAWGPHEDLVDRILGYVTVPPTRLAVALTARELDVLRELPTLRTVEEIAEAMVISVNTLKTHLRSVYRKLGVTSRRDAVSGARRAGLL